MRKYGDEFRREAVRKIRDGRSVASVARELGCAESLLHRWKRDAVEVSSDAEIEVIALRRKLREVEMERDILKTAALIFGRSGWSDTSSLQRTPITLRFMVIAEVRRYAAYRLLTREGDHCSDPFLLSLSNKRISARNAAISVRNSLIDCAPAISAS